MSSSPLTLETLPRDIIVDILHCLNKVSDLHALVTASPTCFRLSKAYITSIYKQTFINMHGPETWKAASTILTYQRNTNPKYTSTPQSRATIKKDLSRPFTLQADDIPQLIQNQVFLNSCSQDYITGNYPRAQSAYILRNTIVDLSRTLFTIDHIPSEPSTFTFDPFLFSADLPYRVWLMSFQYSYSSIDELSNLPPLADNFDDFRLMCHIMSENNLACRFGCMPSRQICGVLVGCRPNGFFTVSVCSRAVTVVAGREKGIYEVNPPLFLKMVGLLREGADGDTAFWIKWIRFMRDYWVMGVEELCVVYELDRFKE